MERLRARLCQCLWLGGILLAGARGLCALEPVTVRSQSGQFIVHGIPASAAISRSPTSGVEYLRLDPTLTAVSLERIRQTILTDFGLPDRWRGPIHVSTHPVEEDYQPVRMAAVHFKDGWGYRVELPERLEKDRFIIAAVQVILLEIANRRAQLHEAELPPWLPVGYASELLITSLPTLALEPGAEIAQRDRNPDPLRRVREVLREYPALTFDELCMPSLEFLETDRAGRYRACAHAFVHELLRLHKGRDGLREMLLRLPENLNWQTTFLTAFADRFPRLIDVDKWYALSTVSLTGRDPMSLWPPETTWQQLEEILITPIQVRLDAKELPIQTGANLQRILREWDFTRQQSVLVQKVNRLQALQLRASTELVSLVSEYARVLHNYAIGRERKGKLPSRPLVNPTVVMQQLDELDARRLALRPSNSGRAER